jgi:hypothetical protein
MNAVDAAINAKYQKHSPFLHDKGMMSEFCQLIDAYQIHYHSKRCQLSNGKCRFDYPQEIGEQTRIHRRDRQFARDAEKENTIPRNHSLLASFRVHHSLEVVH